jgi:peptidoglycan hydrolase-like protein with peptidoglycan-binding domain
LVIASNGLSCVKTLSSNTEVHMRPRTALVIAAFGLPLALAACGNTTEDRSPDGTHIQAASLVTPNGGSSASSDATTVRDIQVGLQNRGYQVGAADGRLGPKTGSAIRRYQLEHGLTVDGQPSKALRDRTQSLPWG